MEMFVTAFVKELTQSGLDLPLFAGEWKERGVGHGEWTRENTVQGICVMIVY